VKLTAKVKLIAGAEALRPLQTIEPGSAMVPASARCFSSL
jgi:hypothetical protein